MNCGTAEITRLMNSSKDGWPVLVDMKVIVPGLVHYDDLKNAMGEAVGGNVLVKKEALDKMAASLEGKPIVNWDHRKVDPKEYSRGKFQGIITGPALFNAADGWYHAKGYVWDDATRRNIENGFSISCAYSVTEWGEGPGTYNQVPYENEVRNGSYTHIAVVNAPRYEDARIELLNSGGKTMGLLSFFRKDKPEEKVEFDPGTAKVAMGSGKDVPLSELINSYEKANPIVPQLLDDDLVEVRGKKVTVRELKNAYGLMENTEEEKKKMTEDEHKNGKHSTSMSNCAMCNAADEEKKKKDDEERANATKEEEEKKNSLKAKEAEDRKAAALRAQELENARIKGGNVEMPKIATIQELVAEGEKRYGGIVATK